MNYLGGLIGWNDVLVSAKILVKCTTEDTGLLKKNLSKIMLWQLLVLFDFSKWCWVSSVIKIYIYISQLTLLLPLQKFKDVSEVQWQWRFWEIISEWWNHKWVYSELSGQNPRSNEAHSPGPCLLRREDYDQAFKSLRDHLSLVGPAFPLGW